MYYLVEVVATSRHCNSWKLCFNYAHFSSLVLEKMTATLVVNAEIPSELFGC